MPSIKAVRRRELRARWMLEQWHEMTARGITENLKRRVFAEQ